MPPPPPQTPDHDESGQPLDERPGQKAGDFVERDLWNLDHDDEDSATSAPTEEKVTPRHMPSPGKEDVTPRHKPSPIEPKARDDKPARPEAPGPYDEPKPAPVVPRKDIHALEPLDEDDQDEDSLDVGPAAEADQQFELGVTDETPDETDNQPGDQATHEVETPDEEAAAGEEPREQPDSDASPDDEQPTGSAPSGDTPEPTPSGEASEFDEAVVKTTPAPAAGTLPFRLSKTELVSLSVLLLAILIGGGWTLKTFFSEIPTRESRVMMPDFPVRGERLSVKTAETFWRKPVRTGDHPDTARMEAELIPVLDMELAEKGGQGALRFFFRDAGGQLVGDSVTRAFNGGTFTTSKTARSEIAATDGFDDEGKHAAYQTSQTEPWIVEVFEGPQADDSRETASFDTTFTLLFKMPIATDRR